jgi:hypothetical protein
MSKEIWRAIHFVVALFFYFVCISQTTIYNQPVRFSRQWSLNWRSEMDGVVIELLVSKEAAAHLTDEVFRSLDDQLQQWSRDHFRPAKRQVRPWELQVDIRQITCDRVSGGADLLVRCIKLRDSNHSDEHSGFMWRHMIEDELRKMVKHPVCGTFFLAYSFQVRLEMPIGMDSSVVQAAVLIKG